jgi:hypothetical protein
VVVTSLPGQATSYAPLDEILGKQQVASLTVVMEGYVSCTAPVFVTVYAHGAQGGPEQTISINGKPIITVGGLTSRRSDSISIQLPLGDHLVQWVFVYAPGCNPSMGISDSTKGARLEARHSRQQAIVARKPTTRAELKLSN